MQIDQLETISQWMHEAQAMVINAGIGIGADSGLANNAQLKKEWKRNGTRSHTHIFDVMNSEALNLAPQYVWMKYHQRMAQFARTKPHIGYNILRNWIKTYNLDYFVLTTNIDDHFRRSGFDIFKIREFFGSIWRMQCSKPCTDRTWRIDQNPDKLALKLTENNLPTCPYCKSLARPNVELLHDTSYTTKPSDKQAKRFESFLMENRFKNIIVFEIGSDPEIQILRKKTRMLILGGARVIRINPEYSHISKPHIGIPLGALDALTQIDHFLHKES